MIELLYAVLIVFPISTICLALFRNFQLLKIYFYPFHLFLWILLIALKPYKKHYLWDKPDFNPIQELPYPPINDINIIYDSNNQVNDIKVTYSNKVFSLIETNEYSKKCINNYFIPQSEACPITDIIVEYSNSNSSSYSDYEIIEISNGYIYYKRDYDQGKFYDSVRIDNAYSNKYILFGNTFKTIKFSYSFDYQNIETIKRLEENKIIQPFKNFKNYINITDLICLFILIVSLIFSFMGCEKDNKCNCFKIIENFLQVILFTLYLIRFILYGKVKKFFKENKDLFTNEHLEFNRAIYFIDYFPKKMSINSFPLALSIMFLFFLLLSLCASCSNEDNSNNNEIKYSQKEKLCSLGIPFFIIYFICFILDIVNDAKIKKIYKNTIDNWNSNPISSIEINTEKDYEFGHIFSKEKEYKFYSWKNNYFTIKKKSDFNYMNIYSNDDNDKKICGTDSFGNNLYFPKNEECPINDIFFENNENINYPEYTKINLGYNNYLFYSNKKTNKKIIIDIKVGFPNVLLELNPEKTNELCNSIYDKGFYEEIGGKCLNYYKFNTIPFYNEIDHWDLYDFLQNPFGLKNINYIGEISLYALTYQGFNSTSNRRNDIIRKYKSKMDDLIRLSIVKSIFTSFNIIYYLYFIYILFEDCSENECCIYTSYTFIGLLFFHFIIIISCLSLNIIYVQKIMNRINNDFIRKRNNYYWILFMFFLDLFFLVYYITLTLGRFNNKIRDLIFNSNNINNNQNNNQNNNNQDNINNADNNINNINNADNNINNINNADNKINNINNADNNDQDNINNIDNNNINNNTDETNKIGGRGNIRSSEENLCIICYTESPCIVFGCGHLCCCSSCYNKIKDKDNKCPLCRSPIDNVIRMYNI